MALFVRSDRSGMAISAMRSARRSLISARARSYPSDPLRRRNRRGLAVVMAIGVKRFVLSIVLLLAPRPAFSQEATSSTLPPGWIPTSSGFIAEPALLRKVAHASDGALTRGEIPGTACTPSWARPSPELDGSPPGQAIGATCWATERSPTCRPPSRGICTRPRGQP
jgi:hypothetical protein